MPYQLIGAFAIGFIGMIAMKSAKTSAGRRLIGIPCMVIMGVLFLSHYF